MGIKIVQLFITLVVVLFHSSSVVVNSQLQVGFYGDSCGCAESVVEDEVTKAFMNNRGVAAGLIRMHFHDCFVRGCDGSTLLDSTASNTAEKDSPVNYPSLRGFEVIDKAKARLESECGQGIVSCADILAFAARDSVKISGGLGYDVPAGRRDGRVSLASETLTELPAPTSNVNQLTQLFATKGLTQEEMVTLYGAHTIGQSHCSSFRDRLYNFNGTMGQDPSLNERYAAKLMQQCPQGNTNSANDLAVVPMDPSSSADTMDVSYYVGLLKNRGLFTSDQTLMSNPDTANEVYQYVTYRDSMLWQRKFADAMVKMGQIDVLTGYAGEIRANCRVINQYY